MRASDRAYSVLLSEIQAGTLTPGTVLAEAEQATRLGVSRTPLREALGRLAADGLVAQQSPRVTVVTEFEAEDIRSLFEARRALEEAAARLAAIRGNHETFGKLAASFRSTAPNTDQAIDTYYARIAEFDAAIDVAVANNGTFASTVV